MTALIGFLQQAVQFADSNNIVLLSLPPHSSHKTQPLDRVFFGPLKSKYAEKVIEWSSTPPLKEYTIKKVAGRFKDAYHLIANAEKGITGFQCTGIYPFNRDIFQDSDFAPSTVTDRKFHISKEIKCHFTN